MGVANSASVFTRVYFLFLRGNALSAPTVCTDATSNCVNLKKAPLLHNLFNLFILGEKCYLLVIGKSMVIGFLL